MADNEFDFQAAWGDDEPIPSMPETGRDPGPGTGFHAPGDVPEGHIVGAIGIPEELAPVVQKLFQALGAGSVDGVAVMATTLVIGAIATQIPDIEGFAEAGENERHRMLAEAIVDGCSEGVGLSLVAVMAYIYQDLDKDDPRNLPRLIQAELHRRHSS